MKPTLEHMRYVTLPCVMVVALATSGAEARTSKKQHDVSMAERDVLERLKLLRVQMALSRPEIKALQERTEKIQLQRTFDCYGGTPKEVQKRHCDGPLLTKAISLHPRKEAIVLYRCRVYNVRPGDVVGDVLIKDITAGGLKLGRVPKKAKSP